jgi:aminoglycoside phosphotransferase (APT) family kinase protein
VTDSLAQSVTVDSERLTEWVGDRLPGAGLLELTRIGEGVGVANALFVVSRGGERWVLRRPPNVVNTPGASDISREWRLLSALEGTPVPHPTPILLCEDAEVIGAPFLVMSEVDGFTPVGTLPAPYNDPQARRSLAFAMVDAIADLSVVEWQTRGLEGLGRPEGFLERQVRRWNRQLDSYRQREVPHIAELSAWLEDNRPEMGAPGIMHGDYSPFNVMASRTRPERLAAVIDWDTGTIGDPLLDIGHLLARWGEPGEEPALERPDLLPREGLPTRAELAARYVERSGRDLSALAYYEVLSLFKLAVILEGGVRRARSNGDEAGAEGWIRINDRLLRIALEIASGKRRP